MDTRSLLGTGWSANQRRTARRTFRLCTTENGVLYVAGLGWSGSTFFGKALSRRFRVGGSHSSVITSRSLARSATGAHCLRLPHTAQEVQCMRRPPVFGEAFGDMI